LTKKGISVWLFSSLTLAAALHAADASSAFLLNNQPRLLSLYPYVGRQLATVSPALYLLAAGATTLLLWGITCAVAFDSPVEQFLNKILTDAKKQSALEAQTVAGKSEVLDAMYETIESSSQTLAQVVDVVHNVRTEVKCIQQLTASVESIKSEVSNLKKEVKKFQEKAKHPPSVCANCGKALSPEFKLCPYCGENVKLTADLIVKKAYR
jgi:rRNA maturation endonuclease Nob1